MNIKHIFVIGFHLNMCVLDKQYGVQNIIRYKLPVILVRDLTDIIFGDFLEENNYTHDNYLEYVISYFEKYYGPSIVSTEIK